MTRLGASAILLLVAFLWGSGNVANKTVLDHIDPLLAAGLRCCFAFALMIPFALHDRHVRLAPGWLRSAFWLTISFAGATVLQQYAYGATSVTNAGFLMNADGILTPVFAWLVLGDGVHRRLILAASIMMAGIFLLAGGDLSLGAMQRGDVISLASAACFALWMILLGQHLRHFARPGVICAFQFGVSGICLVALAVVQGLPATTQIAAALPDLLYLGLIATGAAFLLQARAQQYVSASCAAIITSAESLFGAAGAYLLLGERISGAGAIGAGLILCGIALAALCPVSRGHMPPGNGSESSSARRRVPAG